MIAAAASSRLSMRADIMARVNHIELMAAALEKAGRPRDAGEVPIVAVVAIDGEIAGRGFNQPISSGDPTAHAEIVAIREAAARAGHHRLAGRPFLVTVGACPSL